MSHPVVRTAVLNPLDGALREVGITRTAFGSAHGFSKPYLLRVSQGRQSSLSESVIWALRAEYARKGIDFPDDWAERWDEWIVAHRRAQTLPKPEYNAHENPFKRLVTAAGGYSRMSAILAAPDVLVTRYANGKTRDMPTAIEEALTDMRYEHLTQLKEAMVKWSSQH